MFTLEEVKDVTDGWTAVVHIENGPSATVEVVDGFAQVGDVDVDRLLWGLLDGLRAAGTREYDDLAQMLGDVVNGNSPFTAAPPVAAADEPAPEPAVESAESEPAKAAKAKPAKAAKAKPDKAAKAQPEQAAKPAEIVGVAAVACKDVVLPSQGEGWIACFIVGGHETMARMGENDEFTLEHPFVGTLMAAISGFPENSPDYFDWLEERVWASHTQAQRAAFKKRGFKAIAEWDDAEMAVYATDLAAADAEVRANVGKYAGTLILHIL